MRLLWFHDRVQIMSSLYECEPTEEEVARREAMHRGFDEAAKTKRERRAARLRARHPDPKPAETMPGVEQS